MEDLIKSRTRLLGWRGAIGQETVRNFIPRKHVLDSNLLPLLERESRCDCCWIMDSCISDPCTWFTWNYSYITEKSAYKGPWNIPKRRAKKHPLAPKRPMSAFLKYSQTRRAIVKQDNPDMNNTDVSRLLGEMWRGHSEKERSPYKEEEERERAVYKRNVAEFRARQARLDAASRIPHSSIPTENVRRPSNHVDTVAPYQQQQQHHRHSHHQPPAAAAVEPINAGYRQEQAYHQGSIHRHDNPSVYHHRHPSNSIHRQGSNAHHPYDAHFGYSFPQGMYKEPPVASWVNGAIMSSLIVYSTRPCHRF